MKARTLWQALRGYKSIPNHPMVIRHDRKGDVILQYAPKRGYQDNPTKRLVNQQKLMGELRQFYKFHLQPPRPWELKDPWYLLKHFLKANFLRASVGLSVPVEKLPNLTLAPEKPPRVESVVVGKGNRLTVTLLLSRQKEPYHKLFVRVHVGVQYFFLKKFRPVVSVEIPLRGVGTLPTPETRLEVTLTHFPGGKREWGREEVPFSLLAGGTVRIRADWVALVAEDEGALSSECGEVYPVALPEVKPSFWQRRFRRRLQRVLKKKQQEIRARKIEDGSIDLDLKRRRERYEFDSDFRERKKMGDRRWRREHREHVREYYRKYREEHREEFREYHREYQRKYRETHRERLREYDREYRKKREKKG